MKLKESKTAPLDPGGWEKVQRDRYFQVIDQNQKGQTASEPPSEGQSKILESKID